MLGKFLWRGGGLVCFAAALVFSYTNFLRIYTYVHIIFIIIIIEC